jgi:hypothetical protein
MRHYLIEFLKFDILNQLFKNYEQDFLLLSTRNYNLINRM